MGFSDELLKDSMLDEAGILDDLENLTTYYEDMKVSSRILPASEITPLPAVLAILEPDEKGRERAVTHSFVPMDEEQASFTKFLQFYCELQIDLSGMDRLTLLETLCEINRVLPLGSCVLVPARPELELPLMAAIRYVQGYPLEGAIDQGAFTETLFLFDTGCDVATTVLDLVLSGTSLAEAMKKIYE